MKKMNRKGFTIVELVIVIAVIAVLAAVMIPTFSNMIEKANLSNDTALVANINKILAVESIWTGRGPNDAVEIQKLIKSNGLSLETKSEGNYLWYDIDEQEVILAGLNEEGIDFDVEKNSRGLFMSVGAAGETNKPFKTPSAPEDFVDGYLFISTDSKDGLAQAVCALRNPTDEGTITTNLSVISAINVKLGTYLTRYMQETGVMIQNGDIVSLNTDRSKVTSIIVSADTDKITAESVANLSDFTNPNFLGIVLHSDVKEIDEEAISDINDSEKYIFYVNEALEALESEIDKLKPASEMKQYITDVTVVYIDETGTILDVSAYSDYIAIKKQMAETDKIYTLPTTLEYPYYATSSAAYDFKGYSLYQNSESIITYEEIELGRVLTDLERGQLIKDGALTLYAVFGEGAEDFKINGYYYSSTEVTKMLENGAEGLPSTSLITVVSNNAKLGNSMDPFTLTLPANVELLIPFKADFTKHTQDLVFGGATKNGGLGHALDAVKNLNKDTVVGTTDLEIASNVTLNVASGASIYVDAQLYRHDLAVQNYIFDKLGVLEVNGKIVSNGKIEVYGVIRGNGSIDATGGEIAEAMTIYDWYGGSNAAVSVGIGGAGSLASLLGLPDLSGREVMPFNEWRNNNIRVNMDIRSSAKYTGKAAIFIDKYIPASLELVGGAGTGAVFQMTEGSYVEKSISSDGDSLFIIHGNVNDIAKTMTLPGVLEKSGMSFDANIDFTTIGLPLSHFDVIVAEDGALTLSNNIYKVLPGSDITVNGSLTIGTEVAVYNTYDVKFESKAQEMSGDGITSKSRYVCTFTPIENNKKMQLSSQHQTRKQIWNSWTNDGAAQTTTVAFPYNYSVDTAATFTVNGTLNFNTGAAFAGEIFGNNGATIVANVGVNGYEIKEGWYIQTSIGSFWYDAYVDGLHSAARINGETGALAAGTYTYSDVENEILGTIVGWNPSK